MARAPETTDVPEVGTVLGGKYVVLGTLGSGGMGTVLRARNKLTGKEVALKWMHASAGLSDEASGRLLREAEAASRLNHPNVVNVFDVMYEGDTLFLVMELLEGETLRAYLDREPEADLSKLIAMLLPAMSGVAAAHERGVIHRDLKPDNIFLVHSLGNPLPLAKVVDFGVAKLLNSEGLTLTRTGTSLGTPLYMSLEQLRADDDIDHRTDVYAFGVILYETITGRLPYLAHTLTEFAIKVATTTPPSIKQLRPEIPSRLAYLIEWAIEKDREHRLPDMARLIRELDPFAREQGFRAEMTDPQGVLPRVAAVEPVSPRTIQKTVPRGTPNTLPFARERHTNATGSDASTWSIKRATMLGIATALALAALLIYLLQGETRSTATAPPLVRPLAPPTTPATPQRPTTDLSAASAVETASSPEGLPTASEPPAIEKASEPRAPTAGVRTPIDKAAPAAGVRAPIEKPTEQPASAISVRAPLEKSEPTAPAASVRAPTERPVAPTAPAASVRAPTEKPAAPTAPAASVRAPTEKSAAPTAPAASVRAPTEKPLEQTPPAADARTPIEKPQQPKRPQAQAPIVSRELPTPSAPKPSAPLQPKAVAQPADKPTDPELDALGGRL